MLALMATLLLASADSGAVKNMFGPPATPEGAVATVNRLLQAYNAGNDSEFQKIGPQLAVMLAPDFGMPLNRVHFAEMNKDCAGLHVTGTRPFPKMPDLQAVRITMTCKFADKPQPVDVVLDVLTNDTQAYALFPGGVEHIWPPATPNQAPPAQNSDNGREAPPAPRP